MCNNYHGPSGPLMSINDNGAINHDLAFVVSSEGALDFVEKLQVRESDREVADKHGRVVWIVT